MIKLFITIFVSFFLVLNNVSPAFADKSDNQESKSYQVQVMVSENMFMNDIGLNKIQNIAKDIPESEKNRIFDDYEKDPVVTLFLNMLFPGLGSFIISDYIGALIILGSIFSGLLVFATGFSMSITDFSLIRVIIGGIFMLTGVIYNFIAPVTFSINYNNRLKKALYMREMDSFKDNKNIETPDLNLVNIKF